MLKNQVEYRAFWIARVLFAFKFEYNRPNGNSTIVCHQITIQQICRNLLNGNLVSNSYQIAFRLIRVKRKRNLRYFKFTEHLVSIVLTVWWLRAHSNKWPMKPQFRFPFPNAVWNWLLISVELRVLAKNQFWILTK